MRVSKVKLLIIITLIGCLAFLAFYKSNKINIEGTWIAKKIVLDGVQIYPTKVNEYLKVEQEINISNWDNKIYIPLLQKNINASYEIVKNTNNDYLVHLTSEEKSLNGNFQIAIDTVHLGPLTFQVNAKLKSGKTHLYFQKTIHLKPWKPEFPRRGQV
ncbi:MAG: hypothetical protein JNJ52_14000 [Flavobacterium sp.]|nr:hypothetical protein [Flavobacterium sp.]